MNSQESGSTYFAPAGRQEADRIRCQVESCLEHPVTRTILDMMNGYVMILNEDRQILTCNPEVLEALHMSCPDGIVGLRPGETFGCVHFSAGPDGCGTSPHCRSCGAVIAIMSAMESNRAITEECNLTMKRNGVLSTSEFRVRCTPIELGIGRAIVLVMQDISDSKRRLVLEQMFFHDILNTIGGIAGWSNFLKEAENNVSVTEIVTLAERLKEEVYAQRTLMEAESGELEINVQSMTVGDILNDLEILFRVHDAAHEKKLRINRQNQSARIQTDRMILNRVLINMVKNALEATKPGETVSISTETSTGTVQFRIHNEGLIPDVVQPHIFERSYSTKGRGRGIGTWSMKLLGEQYLDGVVSFTSTEETGTTFELRLPKALSKSHRPSIQTQEPVQAGTPDLQTQTILIVDDNEPVLRLADLFVKSTGARTLCHTNPVDALEEIRSTEIKIDAALVDIGLPVMNGIQLAAHLHKVDPEMPIAFMTGYSEPLEKRHTDGSARRWHLPKPFRKENVIRLIREMTRNAD